VTQLQEVLAVVAVIALAGLALLFGLVNAILGPFLRLIALPFTLLTLGLFALIVNGVLVAITAGLSSKFDVGGFFSAFLAAHAGGRCHIPRALPGKAVPRALLRCRRVPG